MSYINYLFLFNYSFFIIIFSLPYFNLLILLFSSFSIQSSLIFIKFGFIINLIEGLAQTISLGFLFLILQFKEFLFPLFTFTDSFIGSIIYFTTGSHGLHVIIGLFLLLSYFYYLLFFIISNNQRKVAVAASSRNVAKREALSEVSHEAFR